MIHKNMMNHRKRISPQASIIYCLLQPNLQQALWNRNSICGRNWRTSTMIREVSSWSSHHKSTFLPQSPHRAKSINNGARYTLLQRTGVGGKRLPCLRKRVQAPDIAISIPSSRLAFFINPHFRPPLVGSSAQRRKIILRSLTPSGIFNWMG